MKLLLRIMTIELVKLNKEIFQKLNNIKAYGNIGGNVLPHAYIVYNVLHLI